jgi:hypothetical protein
MDSSLLDLNDKSLERGNISFLFNPDLPTEKQFVVLDNNAKTYQRMKQSKRPAEIDEEINVMMVGLSNINSNVYMFSPPILWI